MRIIDAHMHLGEDLLYLTDDSEQDLLAAMEANGVAAMLVQPGIVSRDQRRAHERIARFAESQPGRVFGIACFNPLMEEAQYLDLVRWAVKELGFRGLKLHPNAFGMPPTHPAADKLYRVAEELDVPVMIHTGNGLPNALPSLVIPVAREYPAIRFVLAHAGGTMLGGDALVAAQECPNVYLETSWTAVDALQAMVQKLGPRRVMLGTDLVKNIPVELAKYRALGLAEEHLEWCLGKTAASVFHLP
jgi:uncharacterized protein